MDFNKGKELIGLIVRNKRDKLKLTQEELSARISLDQSNLSNIENGKNFPAFTTFCALVEVLNIEPNEFLRFLNFSQGQKHKRMYVKKQILMSQIIVKWRLVELLPHYLLYIK